MKKVLGLLFVLLLAGCSTPGKPAFFYTWTQYRTGIDINLPKEPKYNDSFHGTLRQDDDGGKKLFVINKHSSDALFTDFSEMSMDEANVVKALDVYENLRTVLR